MDSRSPRSREIIGPRPTPLKIRKDSHKIIKKPPLAQQPRMQPLEPPPPQLHQQEPSQPRPPRGPTIIYTVPPKIIHVHPDDFKALVQRLTGEASTSTTTSSSSPPTSATNYTSASRDTSPAFDALRGSIYPAARYAAMENANATNELGFVSSVKTTVPYYHHHYHHHHQNRAIEGQNCYPAGILSPGPTSLPSISPDFFPAAGRTDPPDLSSLFNDLNYILQSSPSTDPSPSSLDLFNKFFDS